MKHFIDINSFEKKEIDAIISLAKKIKKNPKNNSLFLTDSKVKI